MAFEKVITSLNIQPQYRTFTNDFLQAVTQLSGNSLDSIYMCGSIPKGQAVPGKSDADFTLVFNQTPVESLLKQLETLKSDFLSSCSFITKIDTPVCLVSEVLNNPYDWGFWVKIICICVYGKDLTLNLPELVPSRDFVLGLNEDTDSVLSVLISDYDKNPLLPAAVKLAKRLLRGLYSLTMDREEKWEDDRIVQSEITIVYFPGLEDDIKKLLLVLSGDKKPGDEFRLASFKLVKFITSRIETERKKIDQS
ncbi:MAG: hypothetical protein PF518_16430 [Spirochaetaceae bacterium]|jgi:hypothetical protein|nr:hypothetical protein [Spirochaetaceae bacterium]